jgi:integrase
MSKARKGTVSVASQDGMLRLRWRHLSKPYTLALALADTPLHRRIAQGKASEIQADIAFDRFDETLRKYVGERTTTISSKTLFDRYIAARRKAGTQESTLTSKYIALSGNLKRFERSIDSSDTAVAFIKLLRSRQKPLISNQNLSLLKGFGDWCVQGGHWPTNFFADIRSVKGAKPAREGEPFTRAEITQFLTTLKRSKYYSHYHDLCFFLLSVGCRPGEAHDLRWHQVNLQDGTVTINHTKTDSTTLLTVQPNILSMLQGRSSSRRSDLVFPSPTGKRINTRSFCRRCWKQTCTDAGIPYRVPYFARHSLASHLIESGATYPQVAYVLGHSSTRMVSQTYGRMVTPPQLPEF